MKVRNKACLIGGVWSPETPENSCIPMEGEIDVRGIPKASTMVEFIGWQPSTKRKNPLSLMSLPLIHSFGGPNSGLRGQLYMLQTVGTFVQHSDGLVAALIFDAHGSHQMVRRLLHGDTSCVRRDLLNNVPFFSELSYELLPETTFPRLPIKVAMYRGEPFFGIPGICVLDYRQCRLCNFFRHSKF